jgi:hypothetical protein
MRNGDRKLTLEWVGEPDGSRALVFDAKTWTAYEQIANAQGKTARQLITTAVAEAFGAILPDNYTLNRFMHAGDPDFLRLNKKLKGH